MPRNSEVSRKKILSVAEKIFAEKGFDGSRVDEIANQAGVNKALIYYYFKSKSLILEEIFNNLLQEATELLKRYLSDDLEFFQDKTMEQAFDLYIDYLSGKKDILKILLTESLKSGEDSPPLFNLVETAISQEADSLIKSMRQKGINIAEQKDQIMVTEFFTGIMPIINYVVFKDKWCKHFQLNKDMLRDMFFEAYRATHIAYHKSSVK